MSTLYIRLPSKAIADSAPHWLALTCPFALVSNGNAIEREGRAALSDLSGLIARAQRIVLLVAASDVSLLRVQVPPLSGARLKAALPNLIEDQLISDPSECVIVAGAASEGLRTVAVVQRAWLDILMKTMLAYGARNIAAVPAQLCLAYQAGMVCANSLGHDTGIDLTLRLSGHDGIGLPLLCEAVPQHPEAAANEVLQALTALVPEEGIVLTVPQAGVRTYQEVIKARPEWDQRITVAADNWLRWIAGAQGASLNMMAGLGAGAGAQANWRRWRWPLALAASVLVINVAGLNIDWWRLKREAALLRENMVRVYKTAYPKESVILDPVAQMKQKISAAQGAAGQLAADDFIALMARFGAAWALAVPAPLTAAPPTATRAGIATLEYRERSLFVRLKPETDVPADRMKVALAAHGLSLAQPAAGVWQIRSAK